MVSDHSKGLFDKAISQSGCALNEWANYKRRNWADRLAKKLGWDGQGGSQGLYEFYKTADANEIVNQSENIKTLAEVRISAFGPGQEPYDSEQCFFIKHPIELVKTAWSHNVPLIIGGNSDEGLMFYKLAKEKQQFFETLAGFEFTHPISFELEIGSKESRECAQITRDFYIKETDTSEQRRLKLIDMNTDSVFWYGINKSVRMRLEQPETTAPTYLYRFSFDSEIVSLKKYNFIGEYVKGK